MLLSVRTLASQLVKPSTPPPYPFPLLHSSKLDLVIANIYVKTVSFYKHNEGSHGFFNSSVLTQALSQALSHFYPLAGTITVDMDVECNGNGALFVEALADCTLEDLGDFTPDPQLLQLVPTLLPSVDITLQPLLMVQVTRFECGGAALGVAMEHHVADGFSALSFLKSWSSIARGEVFRSSPSFDKVWLKARTPPKSQFIHDEYLKLPKPMSKKRETKSERILDVDGDHETVVRIFDLPNKLLQRLKDASGGDFSTYEILAAHVWKCCCEARALSLANESMLIMAIDGRYRMNAKTTPKNYIGNVIFNCCQTLSVEEILQSSVLAIATRIRATIKKIDDAYCKSAIDFLEMCSFTELATFVKGPHTFASPNLGFISWTKLPFYDIDFGWGGPTHVGPAHIPWEGHAYLLASAPSAPTRSLRLCINLQRRHMEKFACLLLK